MTIPGASSHPSRSIVAIPACNEAEHLPACLRALAADASAGSEPLTVVVLANNCDDDTAARARACAAHGLDVRVVESVFPPERAHAGHARRAATEAALAIARPSDILLMTDADGEVETGWLAGNRRAIEQGADVVCGRAIIEPVSARAIPAVLHEDDARESAYATVLDEIAWLVDPDPADPWPRHTEDSGASIAVRPGMLVRAGGVPPVASGEDRALLEALRLVDARIRHDPSLRVVVSGRLVGRAAGGMADTMRRRMEAQDLEIDDRLEPAQDHLRRMQARNRLRQADRPPGTSFGACWAAHVASYPLLAQKQRVALADLAREHAAACRIRDALRGTIRFGRAAGPADIGLAAASLPARGASLPR